MIKPRATVEKHQGHSRSSLVNRNQVTPRAKMAFSPLHLAHQKRPPPTKSSRCSGFPGPRQLLGSLRASEGTRTRTPTTNLVGIRTSRKPLIQASAGADWYRPAPSGRDGHAPEKLRPPATDAPPAQGSYCMRHCVSVARVSRLLDLATIVARALRGTARFTRVAGVSRWQSRTGDQRGWRTRPTSPRDRGCRPVDPAVASRCR